KRERYGRTRRDRLTRSRARGRNCQRGRTDYGARGCERGSGGGSRNFGSTWHTFLVNYYPARVRVDLGAIRENVAALAARTPAAVMTVVKADAYGHGLIPVARNAVAAGAQWLGAAQFTEALALR